MDYVLGVLYATKRYEPLDTSRVHPGGSARRRGQSSLLHSTAFAMNSVAGVPVMPDIVGAGSDNDNDHTTTAAEYLLTPKADSTNRTWAVPVSVTAKATPPVKEANAVESTFPLRRGGNAETEPPSLLLPPRTPTLGVDRAPVMTLPLHLPGSRRRSSSLKASGMLPLPTAAADHTLSFSREGSVLSPLVPGVSTPVITSDAVHSATGGGGGPTASGGRPAIRPQRLEYSVPTKVIAGKYVLLYLPPPHRAGETSAAGLWGSVGAGSAPFLSSGGAASGGGGAGASGARAHQTSALLQSPHMDPSKQRLGSSTSSSSSFMTGVSSHTLSTGSGRPNFSAPMSKSVDPSASTSTATVGGHHLSNHHASHSGAGGGPGAAARQAIVRAAAAAASTQQKVLLFYCLLLHGLAHQKPMQEETSEPFLEGRDAMNLAATGPVPVAVLELQYTTEGPVRSNPGGTSSTSTLGGSVGAPAGADGHGGVALISPGATAGGDVGVGSAASPPPSGTRTQVYSPLPVSLSPHSAPDGVRGVSMQPGACFSGGGHLPTTTSGSASPRASSAIPLLHNVGDPFVARSETCADEGSATAAAVLRELLRGSLSNDDVAATQRLSSVLRHLLDGQPDVWLSPDNIAFDSEITQNPYYGGWYSVESNDGYRRVMQMCNIQSWPTVVLVDPAGNVVTVEALQYMEKELARYIDEVDASVARASALRAAAPTTSPITAAASLATGAGSASTSATARALMSASSPSPQASEASQQAPAVPPLPQYRVDIIELNVTEKSPSSPQPRVLLVAESPALSPLQGVATATGRFNTNPLASHVEVAADDGDASTSDSAHTPKRRSTSLLGSTGRLESSASVHDPQIPTAEPTPVKAVPITARYVADSSAHSATSTATPATASISAVTVSPLLPNASMSNNELAAGVQQGMMSPGRSEEKDEQGDEQGVLITEQPFDTAMTSLTRFATDDDSDDTRQKNSHKVCKKSISLTTQPLCHLSMPALYWSAATTASSANFSLNNVCMTKGHASFPSWDPKAYGGDVAGVLAVSDLDSEMDIPNQLGKTEGSGTRVSKDSSSSTREEEGRIKAPTIQVPLASALPLTDAVASSAVAPMKTAEGCIAAAPGAPPISPSSSPAPLPMFSSRFPWNHVLADPLTVQAPLSLMTASVVTATTAASTYAPEEDENVPKGDKAVSSPPLPSLRPFSRRASAITSRGERRRGDAEDGREDSSDFDRATGASSAGAAGARCSTTPSRTPAATAVVPSSAVPRHAGLSSASNSISESPAAIALSHDNLSPRSGGIRGAGVAPLTWSGRRLPMHPLHRLAFCSVTGREVRERARQAANDTALSSSELGKANGQSIAAPVMQEAVHQSMADASNESPVFPSLSLADSAEDASARRLPVPRGLSCQPRSPLPSTPAPPQPSLSDAATQRIMERLLENWQREVAVRLHQCTHLLILFGADWHPGMPKFVRAVRRLCSAINPPPSASAGAPASRKGSHGDGGDVGALRGGLSGLKMQGSDSQLSAGDDDVAPFASWKGFSNSLMDWAGGGLVGFTGGFEDTSSRHDMRSFCSFIRADADGGSASEEGACMASAPPSGEVGAVTDKGAASDAAPRLCVQVIYVSADESLQGVCAAMAEMPADWLCVSPFVARSRLERQLQKHASEMARCIFHVKSFPRMVVVELPSAQQQQQPTNAGCTAAVHTGAISAEDRDEVEDELGDPAGTLTALCDTTVISQQLLGQRLYGLWKVVQLHGETHLCADPEGKGFPWTSESADVLRVKQEDVSAFSRVRRQMFSSFASGCRQPQQDLLHTALSSRPSPPSKVSSPVVFEDAKLLRSPTELLNVSGTSTKKVTAVEKDDWVATADTVSLHYPAERLFPPIKPFLVADGELPSLLERGGYFVVLGAFGSVDSQLHQQCVNALDEVRRWFYAEVEARKQRAWSEPAQLQVMAPHGTYATSFTVGGDRVTLSPAVFHATAGGSTGVEEYSLPTRYSPSITAAATLSVAPGGADLGSASASHRPGHSNFSNRSGSAPLFLEDGWSETRAGLSPKLAAMSSPMPGPLTLQLDSPAGLHGLHVSGARSLASAATAHKPAAAARPLPTVYFYDSILSHPPAPDSPSSAPATHHGGGVPAHDELGVDEEGGLRVRATLLRQASPAPTGTPAEALPQRFGSGDESTAAAAASSPSIAPPPRVLDNTSALRRQHAKDLALLQEYIIAPILEADEKQLPAREGELYLACIRWPQRTSAVLRRRLAPEGRPNASAQASSTGSAAGLPVSSVSSSAAGGSVGGGTSSPASGMNPTLRSLTSSQSSGQAQLLPEVITRRSSTPSGASPLPSSPTTTPVPGNVSAVAAAATSGGGSASSHIITPAMAPVVLPPSSSFVAANAGGGSASGNATGLSSPSLGATNPQTSAATSLSNIIIEEEGKEGSPYSDSTPLASVEAIKSFLYDNVLRLMES
ncbi:conserved hypothetical protein [Leishmania major strain Friedlin]|uniref:Thioredoxin-like fold domain-containing protein n=1 Tax=Leishmania major TaxID=5664 RepID=E9ADX6_LEIMA|nr:conserved hypothetical protein [Leishmania major strain Friedlin]CAG9577855.1 hypothetical_protein_-_conserved [Leishmania major strain Friedlin]CBZ12455.1 conserved hypothetical protein [Leishmania major strain Friedlin]|eukprot:XP_003722197.1 conserved hypothetical protein [Leishmania major strain Friedlin]